MKKTVFIFAIALTSLFFVSCGGSDNEEQTKETEKTGPNIYKGNYLSFELEEDWDTSPNSAHNTKTGHSIFSFGVYSSGDIHNDFLVDHEQIGEITETIVDGMPALTRLQKYKQKEMRIGRVWLIYNGTDGDF